MNTTLRQLEKNVNITASTEPNITTFRLNKTKPIHRWYYFKEGFSYKLIEKLKAEFGISNSDRIIDCFSGSGTTVLAAQELGIMATGIEINPFFRFMSTCKIRNGYDVKKIRYYEKKLLRDKKYNKIQVPLLTSFQKCLSRKSLQRILELKSSIQRIKEPKYQKLFLFMLASILQDVGCFERDGKGLKIVNRKPQQVNVAFKQKTNEIISDINYKHENNIDDKIGTIVDGDARDLSFVKGKFDFAIFSPPYINSFDYSEVYKLELWLLDFVKDYEEFRQLSESTLRSHLTTTNFDIENHFENEVLMNLINTISRKDLWNKNIPNMIRSYFNDMRLVFSQLYKILKKNAKCIVAVGNSAYGGIVIPTDLLLGHIAEEVGFKFEKLEVVRSLKTSSQQYKQIQNKRFLRESLVYLRK